MALQLAFHAVQPVQRISPGASVGRRCKRQRTHATLGASDGEVRRLLRGRAVVVSGASGVIGRALVPALRGAGAEVTVLTRTPGAGRLHGRAQGVEEVRYDAARGALTARAQQVVRTADVVVNLAGETIDAGRWTAERKAALRASRVRGTRALATVAGRRLVQASAVGYYGAGRVGTCVESTPPALEDFLSVLASDWEAAAGAEATICRFGVVLAPDGGALPRMATAFRAWVGGCPGGGSQWFSWVHRDDVVRFLLRAAASAANAPAPADVDNDNPAHAHRLQGAYNVCAPQPVTLREFCAALAEALGRPCWAPIPDAAIKALMGAEAAQLVLQGQRVVPQRALKDGFVFKHPSVRAAVRDALGASVAAAR